MIRKYRTQEVEIFFYCVVTDQQRKAQGAITYHIVTVHVHCAVSAVVITSRCPKIVGRPPNSILTLTISATSCTMLQNRIRFEFDCGLNIL